MLQRSPSAIRHSTLGLRLLIISGSLLLAGYIALFFVLQFASMGYPSLIPQQLPQIFGPLRAIFPTGWLDAGRTSELGLLNAFLYLVVIAWLLTVYLLAIRRAFAPRVFAEAEAPAAFRRIILFASASLFVLLFVWYMLSTDIYNYIWIGRILGLHGDNPYINVPLDYKAYDTTGWLQWGIWLELPNNYGPLWTALAALIAVVAQVGDGEIVYHLLGHRLFASLAHLLNIWLIWHVSRLVIERFWRLDEGSDAPTNRDQLAGRRIAITLAFAWNPLLLIEFGVSGHNDAPIITLVLAAIWLHLVKRWRLAVFALALAGLIKYTALLFMPAYLLLLFWEREEQGSRTKRQSLRRVAESVAIVILTWGALFAPFWDDAAPVRSIPVSPASYSYNHSIGKLLVAKANEGVSAIAVTLGAQPAQEWEAGVLRAKFDPYVKWGLRALSAVLIALAIWQARTFPRMLTSWGWTLFTYLTIGSIWFWPWYVSWLLVPVALSGPSRLWTATQILCVSSLTMYAVFPRLIPPFAELATWTGLFIMAPPLLYLVWAYLLRPAETHNVPVPSTQS